ncbi:MAG TPA: hypothetical protein VMT49_06645 [Steroidobacteraceae bacterium]|nr:hypothetical protein [Steroidobacteraceae bacterium]
MNRLILVLRDLYPARLEREALARLPRLPSLEQWLARADALPAPGGWRTWLWREFALPTALAGDPALPAAVAAAAVPRLPAGKPLWLATPVHFVAGLDTVRLHPAGLVELDEEAQRALAADFGRVFDGAGYTLHATGRREMLLAGGAPAASGGPRNDDPAMWLGADPRGGLPTGANAAALRRLGAEMEMWLHEHPVNLARSARGQLPANALWLWGGGAPAVISAVRAAPAALAWTEDLYIDGLARLRAAAVTARPGSWPEGGASAAPAGELLVDCGLGAASGAEGLRALEREWIAPALAQWQGGRWDRAILLAGERAITLQGSRWRHRWRRWRRVRPWWEWLLR